jgi:hypothetical protein
MFTHRKVEGFLSGVPERRMTHVVHQRQSLDEINVQTKLTGDGSRDLRNFNCVR